MATTATSTTTTSTTITPTTPTPTPTPVRKGLPYPPVQAADDPTAVEDGEGNLVSVPTKMNYVTPDTTVVHVHRDVSGSDSGFTKMDWNPVTVQVHNARRRDQKKTVHRHGFELVDRALSKPIDFLDTEQVTDTYYPDCEALLREVLGDKVALVKAFDHNVRISSGSVGSKLKGGGEAKAQVPLGIVHGDYTKDSGPTRLDDLGQPPKTNDVLKSKLGNTPLLDPATVQETLQGKRRFALINVWRNLDPEYPVEELPLACVDSSSVAPDDLRVLQIHYPDRVGENYFVVPNPEHQWCFYPKMTHSEAILIKQWDSFGAFALDKAEGPSTFALHSAFLDPTSPDQSAKRRSIEVRCVVIWNEEE